MSEGTKTREIVTKINMRPTNNISHKSSHTERLTSQPPLNHVAKSRTSQHISLKLEHDKELRCSYPLHTID